MNKVGCECDGVDDCAVNDTVVDRGDVEGPRFTVLSLGNVDAIDWLRFVCSVAQECRELVEELVRIFNDSLTLTLKNPVLRIPSEDGLPCTFKCFNGGYLKEYRGELGFLSRCVHGAT